MFFVPKNLVPFTTSATTLLGAYLAIARYLGLNKLPIVIAFEANKTGMFQLKVVLPTLIELSSIS